MGVGIEIPMSRASHWSSPKILAVARCSDSAEECNMINFLLLKEITKKPHFLTFHTPIDSSRIQLAMNDDGATFSPIGEDLSPNPHDALLVSSPESL
uniref:Uncharacterized protein n=1 Tax=Kalanchoe fedtschenkoi TaxID=63787 RepID=A0A7N0V9R4_KALFE